MQHFIKVNARTKKDKELTKLTSTATNGNIQFFLNFIDQLLLKMIHRRIHLHHYRYSIQKVLQNVDAVCQNVDFAVNLSITVKYEPQSQHWSHEQVTYILE